MKNIFTVFFVLLFGKVFSQMSFFIRPSINWKAEITSNSLNGSELFNDNSFTTPDFTYKSTRVIIPNRLTPLLLGISIGLNTKNQKLMFEFGINQDESSSKHVINGLLYDSHSSISSYYFSGIGYHDGLSFGRYLLTSSYLINKKPINKTYLTFGCGFANRLPHSNSGNQDFALKTKPTNMIFINDSVKLGSRKSLIISFGLSNDFYKKDKYLFSLDLTYSKNFSMMTYLQTDVKILESGFQTKHYTFNNYSRGSGIYLRISRKIKFNFNNKKSK